NGCFLALHYLISFCPALHNKDGIGNSHFRNCPPFYCGNLGEIKFPFPNSTRPEYCSPFVIDDCNKVHPNIQLEKAGRWYELENISQANTLLIVDRVPEAIELQFIRLHPLVSKLKANHSFTAFGLGGLAAMMIISSSLIIICRRYKESNTLRDRISITTTPNPSEPDLDGAIVGYGVPVFSYVELEEATHNFSTEKEHGNGGYGTELPVMLTQNITTFTS
ncbi:hypothetical protein Tsubulata_045511, partial [Turnera subulata]